MIVLRARPYGGSLDHDILRRAPGMAVEGCEQRTRDPHRRNSRNFPIPEVANVGEFGGYLAH